MFNKILHKYSPMLNPAACWTAVDSLDTDRGSEGWLGLTVTLSLSSLPLNSTISTHVYNQVKYTRIVKSVTVLATDQLYEFCTCIQSNKVITYRTICHCSRYPPTLQVLSLQSKVYILYMSAFISSRHV